MTWWCTHGLCLRHGAYISIDSYEFTSVQFSNLSLQKHHKLEKERDNCEKKMLKHIKKYDREWRPDVKRLADLEDNVVRREAKVREYRDLYVVLCRRGRRCVEELLEVNTFKILVVLIDLS